jgi:hypothetical protein
MKIEKDDYIYFVSSSSSTRLLVVVYIRIRHCRIEFDGGLYRRIERKRVVDVY